MLSSEPISRSVDSLSVLEKDEKVSILLVDDRPDKIMSLEVVLAPLQERLVFAHSGRDALRCLLHQDFAVILLDVNMPVMDGFETAALIRQRKNSELTPIIFVSAINDTENHLSRGYSLGAVDYILTPVVPEILRAKVGFFVDLFRKTEQLKRQAEERAEFIREQAARAEAEAGRERLALLYDEARAAREAAEAANAAKDRFLAMLSHQLRTPLTPVLNTVEELENNTDLSPDVREAVAMIRRNVELEARLIDDLLDLTRITKGKVRLRLENVDAHLLIDTALNICRDDLRAKDLHVVLELRATEHFLRADAARMHQVFWNLLKNAVKFTPPGGRLTVRSYNPAPGKVRFDVEDTGVGIPPEALATIFDAFEQGTHASQGGLGLGLAIAKAVLDLHEGGIIAASAGTGLGAVFTLELAAAGEPPPGTRATEPAATEMGQSHHANGNGNGTAAGPAPRVLLVDDHADTLRSLQRLLMRRGYLVATAPSVRLALEAVDTDTYDLVISDVGLPDGTGMDLMRTIRERCGEHLPGIALSGYGMEEDVNRSLAAGFGAHLTKPVDLATLDATMRQLLRPPVEAV